MDQTIQETINRRIHIGSGTKRFSTQPNAVGKCYIAANDHANYTRQLRALASTESYKFNKYHFIAYKR